MRRALGLLVVCFPVILRGQDTTARYPLDGLHISWVSEVPETVVRRPVTTTAALPWGSTFASFVSAIQFTPDTGQFEDFEYPYCFDQALSPETNFRKCPLSLELPRQRVKAVGWFVRMGSRPLPVAALFHESRLVGYELFVPPAERAGVMASLRAALGAPVQETRVVPSVAPVVVQTAYLWRSDSAWVVFQHATSDEIRNPASLVVLATTARASSPEHPVWSGYVQCPLMASLEIAGARRRCP